MFYSLGSTDVVAPLFVDAAHDQEDPHPHSIPVYGDVSAALFAQSCVVLNTLSKRTFPASGLNLYWRLHMVLLLLWPLSSCLAITQYVACW